MLWGLDSGSCSELKVTWGLDSGFWWILDSGSDLWPCEFKVSCSEKTIDLLCSGGEILDSG